MINLYTVERSISQYRANGRTRMLFFQYNVLKNRKIYSFGHSTFHILCYNYNTFMKLSHLKNEHGELKRCQQKVPHLVVKG